MSLSPKSARRWSSEEDQKLRNILASITPGADINWHQVASHIHGRNNKECRKRWIYSLMPTLKKGPWNDREDALLLEGVRLHGPKWPLVSQSVGTRQPDQCSRRWHESLNPGINHGRWSLREDQILREAVQQYGRRWTEIVERYFPHRTPIAAKKRYAQFHQQKLKQMKSDSDPESSSRHSGTAPTSPSTSSFKRDPFKREGSETSSHLLWSVPDHTQIMQGGLSRAPLAELSSQRYIPESPSSVSVPPVLSQFANMMDLTQLPFTAPPTPHYSPAYSRDGSLGGASAAAAEYPTVTAAPNMWMPAETQSAYSGSPFVFHDTGYFDPTYVASTYAPQSMRTGRL